MKIVLFWFNKYKKKFSGTIKISFFLTKEDGGFYQMVKEKIIK